jgi:pyochelin biosynthesis protein PchC
MPTVIPLTGAAEPTVDLVGFPFAGGSPTAYQAWKELLPASWRLSCVLLPGRGSRFGEEFHHDVSVAADEIAAELRRCRRDSLVLFGHSVGALLGLEVARRMAPRLLAVAACQPPVPGTSVGDDQAADPAELAQATRDALITAGLRDPALLDELVELNTPILAADMRLLHGYLPPGSPVDCDIVAYYGSDDNMPAEPWLRWTSGSATTVEIPGDHYFVQNSARRVIADLAGRLEVQRHDEH